MSGLDQRIHHPTRLTLMTVLASVTEAEFVTLRDRLDVSDSVLSKHLAALADGGYLTVRKAVHQGRRTTWAGLTRRGRSALDAHVAALRALIDELP